MARSPISVPKLAVRFTVRGLLGILAPSKQYWIFRAAENDPGDRLRVEAFMPPERALFGSSDF
jgi:hypothetical protein